MRRTVMFGTIGIGIAAMVAWADLTSGSDGGIQHRPGNPPALTATDDETEASDPIAVVPYRNVEGERTPFRVVDIVTGRPLEGASICGSIDGGGVYSIAPTDALGAGQAVFPPGWTAPGKVFVVLPSALGGKILAATVERAQIPTLAVPAFARITVQTARPNLTSPSEDSKPLRGWLWCVSWPTPAEVFKSPPRDVDPRRLASLRDMMGIISGETTQKTEIEYHEMLRRVDGCDRTRLICIRDEVEAGFEHSFDIAYGGETLLSYDLPDFNESMKVKIRATPGETTKVQLPTMDARRIRLRVLDDTGEPVAGSHVSVVVRRELESEDPHPDGAFFVFTPKGSEKRISVRRWNDIADREGSVELPMLARLPGSLFVSATAPGHIGEGVDLWSGIGVPDRGEYRVVIKRADPQRIQLLLRGQPVRNRTNITVTDLKPISLLGQIVYPTFSTDGEGWIDLEQLVVGKHYAIAVDSDGGLLQRQFHWAPGVSIEF